MKDIKDPYQAVCPYCAEPWADNLTDDIDIWRNYFYRSCVRDYMVPCPDCYVRLCAGEDLRQTIIGLTDPAGVFNYPRNTDQATEPGHTN